MFGPNKLAEVFFNHNIYFNINGKLYAEMNIPFLVKTTIGYHEQLIKYMYKDNHFCVIAQNIAKSDVALQLGLEDM